MAAGDADRTTTTTPVQLDNVWEDKERMRANASQAAASAAGVRDEVVAGAHVGGHGGGEGTLLGDLDLGDGRLGDDCGEEKKRSRGEGGVVSAMFGGVGAMIR